MNQLDVILEEGEWTKNRTGVKTIEIFGMQARYNLQLGFPAITIRKLTWKSMVSELLWFISGSQNLNDLKKIYPYNKFWDPNYEDFVDRYPGHPDHFSENEYRSGYLGYIYGYQWRNFPHRTQRGYALIDQIAEMEHALRNTPDSRRIIVSAWNPGEVTSEAVALPPCHVLFQCRVINGKLHLQMFQRSCDMFLGVPINIASYSLLTYMIAHIMKLEVGTFIHTMASAHIYANHVPQVHEMLRRHPFPPPTLSIVDRGQTELRDFVMSDFELLNYQHHPQLKGDMAV